MTPNVGPDGKYIYGRPLKPDDRGGLYAAIRLSKELGVVSMDFGTVVDWVAIPPEYALNQAAYFRKAVREEFGELSYDASTLPLKIQYNPVNRTVETRFPTGVEVLIANPEMFLAWADKLEEAANKINPPSA